MKRFRFIFSAIFLLVVSPLLLPIRLPLFDSDSPNSSAGTLFAQRQILTAGSFFKSVSDYYATIFDYEANIQIVANKNSMYGRASFKRPNLLRIDFSSPRDQVIIFNGDMLTIYLPGASAILSQAVDSTEKQGANLATAQGLSLMSRYYNVAYEIGQDPVPLEDGSGENVIKLLLTRKSVAEGFTTIKLAINPNSKLIRKVEAVTPQNVTFTFTFSGYRLNQGLPNQRFIYDLPSSANSYNNFLFSE